MALATESFAATSLTVTPLSLSPTRVITVNGTGFAASEAVDVYLDTTDMQLIVSSATGALSTSFAIPAGAQPGRHYVTAVGRRLGDAAQATATVTTPWLQFNYGDGKLGLNPFENTLSPSTVPSLGLLWSSTLGSNGSTPAISSGYVFTTGQPGVQKLNAATGAVVWNVLPSSSFYASPAVSNGVVYVSDFNGNEFALSAATGATKWTVALGGPGYGSPTVVGSMVYVTTSQSLYALSTTTGAVQWSFPTGGLVDSSVAVVNGIAYFGSTDDKVYALNASTGAQLWSYTTGGAVECTPAIALGVAYVCSDDGKLYALRAKGGSLIWTSTIGGQAFISPSVANGVIYIGSTSGSLFAIDTHHGTALWSFLTDSYPRQAAVANGVIYFTSNIGGLYALNANSGAKLLYGQSGPGFLGGPAVSDGAVYVNATGFGLTAYALFAGNSAMPHKPQVEELEPDYSLGVTF